MPFGDFNLDSLKHEVQPYVCLILLVTEMLLIGKRTCLEVTCSYKIATSVRQPEVFLLPLNQVKTEVVKEVAAARRKQHLSSLQYYCALNALQYRKRMAMVEPMMGFAHGQVRGPSRGARSKPAVGDSVAFC